MQEQNGKLLQAKVKHIPPTSLKADGVLVTGSKVRTAQPCMSVLTPSLLEKRPSEKFGQFGLVRTSSKAAGARLQGQDQAARMSDSVCQSRAKTKSRS